MCDVSIATPADVSLLMQLGVDGVFVGSGIFKSDNPKERAKAMVMAVTHYGDPQILARVSEDIGQPMVRTTQTLYLCAQPFLPALLNLPQPSVMLVQCVSP